MNLMEPSRQIKRVFLGIAALLSLAGRAEAQTVGGSCPTTGWTSWASANPGELLYCNGTTWGLAESITSAGLVGIGTAGPLSALDVNGGVAIGAYAGNNAAPSNGLIVSGSVGIGTTSPNGKLSIGNNVYSAPLGSSYGQYQLMLLDGSSAALSYGIGVEAYNMGFNANGGYKFYQAGGGTPLMVIGGHSSTNVGIGSTSPIVSLDVSQKTDAIALPVGTTGQRPGTVANGEIRYNSTLAALEAYINGAWESLVTTTGTTSTITFGASAASTNPQVSGDATTGFYTAGAGKVDVAITDVQTVEWNSAGENIVTGSLKISGNNGLWQDTTNQDLAIGATALPSTISQAGGGQNGQYDIAIGYQALNANTTGTRNVALGTSALQSNTTGSNNTAVGYATLSLNTTGFSNTAVGQSALGSNTAGSHNTAFGVAALPNNTTGVVNTALGDSALKANTTGSGNTAAGYYALLSNTTGTQNTAVGVGASANNTTGGNNTAVGYQALNANTTGSNNTVIGYNVALSTLSTGSNNILIGTSNAVDTPASSTSNFLNIGNVIFATGMTGTLAAPAGSVGIGTASPTYPLHIYTTTNQPARFEASGRAITEVFSDGDASAEVALSKAGGTVQSWHLTNNQTTQKFTINDNTNGKTPFTIESNTPASTMYLNASGYVGIGSTSPVSSLDISQKTDALALPLGTTGQRPTPVNGMIRYNSSVPAVEGYVNGSWLAFTTGSLSTITLGTQAATTNPQRSGDGTTGLYTPGAQQVAVAANGIEVEQWNTVASGVDYFSITPGLSGTAPKIAAAGSTATQHINLVPKGSTGVIQFAGNTMFWQDAANFNTISGISGMPATLSQTGGGNNGQYNTALGYQALNANTTGAYNTAVGVQALYLNSTGVHNTAVGTWALSGNTIGTNNIAIGHAAMQANTTGANNTAVGTAALNALTTGQRNTALGANALNVATTDQKNTAIGYNALLVQNGGGPNTAVGYSAGSSITTGYGNNIIGAQAFGSATTDYKSIAIGDTALQNQNGAALNIGIGYNIGSTVTTGSSNVLIGPNVASTTLATGSNNILIGTSNAVDTAAAGTNYNLNIGNLLQGDMTNSTSTYNKTLYLQSTSSGVNYLQVAGAATTNAPVLSARGSDTNISVELLPKGTGGVGIGSASPQSILDITDTQQTAVRGIRLEYEVANNAAAKIILAKGRGSAGAPATVANSDYVGNTSFFPYVTTSGFMQTASVGAHINGTVSGTSAPTDLYFHTGSTNDGDPYTNNEVRMVISSTGNVGIGTVTPSYTLQVNGSVAGTSAYNNTSDARLKKNVVPITGSLDLVNKLRGVHFDWRTPTERAIGKNLKLPVGTPQVGFIAQEVQEVLPEAVTRGPDGIYSMQESKIVPVLLEAVKELEAQNVEIKRELASLREQLRQRH